MKKRQRKKQHKIKTLRHMENYVEDMIKAMEMYVNKIAECTADDIDGINNSLFQMTGEITDLKEKVFGKPKPKVKKAEATNE